MTLDIILSVKEEGMLNMSWLAKCVPCLTPKMRFFLWKILDCALCTSTSEELHRMNIPNASSQHPP